MGDSPTAAGDTVARNLLLRLAASDPAARPRLVETHISWVLLVGDRAYKIKKPVDLGFLDFTSFDVRRALCHDETRLNRRLAPELYLGVVRVTGTPDHPAIEGPGPLLAHAVCMRRFPDVARLDRALEAGLVDASHMSQLAGRIAGFHRSAPVAGKGEGFGTPARIERPIRECLSILSGRLPETDLAVLDRWIGRELERLVPEIEDRRELGFVRECHGDLHLSNLVLLETGVTAFDCLEFDPALRWIDTTSEIAFVSMDLVARNEAGLACRFLSEYWEASGDHGGAGMLRLYTAYRALVRAKVAALSENVTTGRVEAHRYLQTALQQIAPASPLLILTQGVSGSGKSRAADALVGTLPAIRLRSDVERKRLHGLAPEDRGTDELYSEEAGKKTFAHLRATADGLLRAGLNVIVDATFLRAADREPFAELARERGVPSAVLACRAPEEVLASRVRRRRQQEADPSDADEEVLRRQLASMEPVSAAEGVGVVDQDTSRRLNAGETATRLRAAAGAAPTKKTR
jgi:aminoglycoside phosphotransferase family enzyme